MSGTPRIFGAAVLALSLLLLTACGDGTPASNSGNGAAKTTTPAFGENLVSPTVSNTTADYVLNAEKCWSENDRATAIDLYKQAIQSATKEGNTVQAGIFSKRLAQIEKAK